MYKPTYKLIGNPRVQELRGRNAAPNNNEQTRKKINFVLSVACAADYPCRIVKLENMQHDILIRKLYTDMTPLDLFKGKFRVTEGFEDKFKKIASEHGFNASEAILCE